MTTNFTQKNSKKFNCNYCDFNCSNKNDYKRHILTRKHEILQNTTEKNVKNSINFICECGKEYKHHSSLWNHKKKCNFNIKETEEIKTYENVDIDIDISDKNLILTLIQQNNELQKQILEVCKNGIINNNTNIQSSTFFTPFYISNAYFILLRMISNNYVCILILFFYCLPILDNLIHLYAKNNYLF